MQTDLGALVPFVMCIQGDKKTLTRFVHERLEGSVAAGRRAIAELPADVEAYAFAYDAFITLEDVKSDAIIVEGCEQGRKSAGRMAQQYVPKKFMRRLKTLGKPAYVGECESMFT